MPPLPISAVSLPEAFISAILEGDRENDFTDPIKDQQNMLLATSSVDRDTAFSCIQRFDIKIQSVKLEVLQMILERKEDFVKLYNNSVSLRDKIDTLFKEVDDVSRGINHPEIGMKPKLIDALQENRMVMQEVKNTKSVVETLEYLNEIQNCIKRFHEYLTQGRIEEASGTITYLDNLLESPPIQTEQKIQIFDKLKSQLSTMKESLEQTLDDLLSRSISFKKIEDEEFSLTVLSSLEGANATTLLTSVFISLNEVDSINMQLSRLKKNVMKYLIMPLLEHRESWNVFIEVDDDITARLIIKPSLNTSQDGVFTSLITIFKFIYKFIFGGLDPSSKELVILPLSTQYASVFGKFISHDLRDVVISEYLSHVIPTETFEFKKFDDVARDVRDFQAEMRKMGYMRLPRDGEEEEERTLGAYVSKVDVHFTIKKRDKLLELGRNVMLDENFESEEITEEQELEQKYNEQGNGSVVRSNNNIDETDKQKEELKKDIFAMQNDDDNPNDGWDVDWNEGWDEGGWDEQDTSQKNNESLNNNNISSKQVIIEKILVRYSISNKVKPLIDLTIKTLNEARNLNAKSEVRLYQAVRDLFDLYRAIMPVFHYNTLSNVPALAMLFRNDCLWLADQLLIVQGQFKDNPSSQLDSEKTEHMKDKFSYNETVGKLRELGKEWYDLQIDKQKSVLKEILDEMDGVQQIATDDRFEACQNAMNQIIYTMNHLSKIWKNVLRPTEHCTALGELINSVLTCMIDNVEDLYDISAEDSHQLNLICTMLFQLENLFNKKEANLIEKYVKNWTKFRHITDILELSQAEIMNRFRNGKLVCFTADELEGLICALFADTQIRENTLLEIREGYKENFTKS